MLHIGTVNSEQVVKDIFNKNQFECQILCLLFLNKSMSDYDFTFSHLMQQKVIYSIMHGDNIIMEIC